MRREASGAAKDSRTYREAYRNGTVVLVSSGCLKIGASRHDPASGLAGGAHSTSQPALQHPASSLASQNSQER